MVKNIERICMDEMYYFFEYVIMTYLVYKVYIVSYINRNRILCFFSFFEWLLFIYGHL